MKTNNQIVGGAIVQDSVEISNEQLAFGRCRLLSAVEHSDGKEFEYSTIRFPVGTAEILVAELADIGWGYELVLAPQSADYYRMFPLPPIA